ncbi:MAG: class II aldolase/adducin family protein [Actinomycetota bacterium]|nr:class II aldolase/adducin family protein [Actinomycetota bacterium]
MTSNSTYPRNRRALVEAGRSLSQSGVMSHTGHINFSARLDDERMLMTSTGLVQEMEPDALAVVRLDGRVEDGELTPSTQQIVPMHSAVYRARGGVAAVVHTHSPHLTAFALAARALPCRYEPLLRLGQIEAVPVVAWAPRGSDAFVAGVEQALALYPGTLALLLANHGLLGFGSSPAVAAKLVILLEEAAEAELRAAALGGAKDFPLAATEEVLP